jgi:polyhydroxyalkanoate synthesis regulator phasin
METKKMNDLLEKLLADRELEDKFIEYLKKLRSDLDVVECKQIEDREDTTEQLERLKSRLDKLERKKK